MNQLEESEIYWKAINEYMASNLRTYYYSENSAPSINWWAIIAVILFLLLIFK